MTSRRAQSATGRKGMVVSGSSDATQAAWHALSSGGGVDAAIADGSLKEVADFRRDAVACGE